MGRLRLPAREDLIQTNEEDPIEFYYHPLWRFLYRRRLEMVLDLLEGQPGGRWLEIGYGSGILLPSFARWGSRLFGLDPHGRAADVKQALAKLGVEADLRVGTVYDLPYPEHLFSAVVCVSVLEHLDDLDRAIGEIDRVLAPNGIVVGGFPVNNSLTGALFRLVGFRPEEIHPSSHTQILQALQRRFRVTRMLRLPRALPLDMCLYAACQCKKTVAGVRPSPTEETQE